ncbi:MAG: hypothetical protein AAGN35_08035 [Bacteroidota bacterium]
MNALMVNRWLFFLCGVLISGNLIAQGPPVRISTYTVTNKTKFKQVPLPMTGFEVGKYASEAGKRRGQVQLYFEEVKAGKFKDGTMSLIARDGMVLSVTLDTDSPKGVKRLLKQLTEQFGEPYKLVVRNGKFDMVWTSPRKSSYRVQYTGDQNYQEASVTIEKQKK